MKYRMRDIENFVLTARCTTIIEASKLLGIGQPALSESIQRLEADCNKILFYRSRSGIQLTPQGREFLQASQFVMKAVGDLDSASDSEHIFGRQEISIGCHPTVAMYTLPKALAMLERVAPDFRINLQHDLSRNIQSEIQRGRIDIGIVINPMPVPDLVIKEVARDIVGVWSKPNQKEDDCQRIICNPHLVQTQTILKKWKKKPPQVIAADNLELICRLTASGIGFGVIPERAVQLSNPELKCYSSLPQYEDRIAIVYRPEFGKSLAEKLLIDCLKKTF